MNISYTTRHIQLLDTDKICDILSVPKVQHEAQHELPPSAISTRVYTSRSDPQLLCKKESTNERGFSEGTADEVGALKKMNRTYAIHA